VSRFVQAISEGDGISVVPLLSGEIDGLARAAAEAGAEAVAVDAPADVLRVRESVTLPVLLRGRMREHDELDTAHEAGADAVVLVFGELEEEGDLLERLYERSLELGFACAIAVQDEEELALALERIDPDIVAISCPDAEDEQEELERTLDVLPDVPVGKLVIAEARALVREQAVALERAGVDAILVADVATGRDFARALADLVGDAER
jgi:indole-3-glycerol phosphate synthase